MTLTHSFQGKMLRCTKGFSFFIKGQSYYCTYDTGEHFYVWCGQAQIPVNEIKLSNDCKKFFTWT
jgi:hypothetical protein